VNAANDCEMKRRENGNEINWVGKIYFGVCHKIEIPGEFFNQNQFKLSFKV
jgi:hypothetical protein